MKRVLEDLSFQFLGLSTFQILAVMGEVHPDADGMVNIVKWSSVASEMIYTMVELSGQNLRFAAVEHLSQTEGVNFLRGLSMDDVKAILKNAFSQADKDSSGTLSIDEIGNVLRALGEGGELSMSERDINAIMSAIGARPILSSPVRAQLVLPTLGLRMF